MKLFKSALLDHTGMMASLACAIHCAAVPLLATFLPLWGMEFLANPIIETAMLALSLCIGILSLGFSFHQHRKVIPIFVLAAGFVCIGIGHVAEAVESYLIPIGGLAIALAHFLNTRYQSACKKHP